MINEYDVLLEIFSFVRCYSTSTYSLPSVLKKLIQYMKDGGYKIQIIDDTHMDYKIIQVETQRYKLIRFKDWCTYDVQMTV